VVEDDDVDPPTVGGVAAEGDEANSPNTGRGGGM
jgi:hypothetical protein